MTHHMLVIGGSRDVHPKIKDQGVRMTMMFDIATLKNRKSMSIYERLVALPVDRDLDAWISIARILHATDSFDSIGGFNEATQEIAAHVARDLGLRFHTPEVIRATRQKDFMREILRAKGIDETDSRIVSGIEEIKDFVARNGYPLILKPVDGRGSVSISVVRSEDDLPGALAWFAKGSPTGTMLVEQFLEGPEWSVEAFSEGGVHKIVCVTQKFKDPNTFVETGHCLPAPMERARQDEILNFVPKVLTALGIENGPSHTEIICTPKGPRIVETHARLAGDCIVDLIRHGTGVDLDRLWIRQVCGESVLAEVPQRFETCASIAYATPRAHGTLVSVEGIETAKTSPGVVHVESLQDPGAFLVGADSSNSRGAFVIALGETTAQAVANARSGLERIKFVVSCEG